MAESSLLNKVSRLFGKSTSRIVSTPVPFGHKTVWIAVRSADPELVAKAVPLRSIQHVSWEAGIEAAYAYPPKHVFVTPPVSDWVCIVGLQLDGPIEAVSKNLIGLSKTFGEAHLYANHRVVGLAQWILARDGEIVRCYSYLGERGEVMADHGVPTDVELTLRPEQFSSEDWFPDEDDVMKVASAWSFDPSQLNSASGPPASGILGTFG